TNDRRRSGTVRRAMGSILRGLLFVLGMMTAASAGVAGAQVPAPAPVPGPIYSAIYVEVMPTATATGAALLSAYREATRKEDGNLRCEVVQRIGQPNQFVVLSAWRDQKAFEAHAARTSSTEMREKITAIRNAPTDERVHVGLVLGSLHAHVPSEAVYAVTHADLIPPPQDDPPAP